MCVAGRTPQFTIPEAPDRFAGQGTPNAADTTSEGAKARTRRKRGGQTVLGKANPVDENAKKTILGEG